MDRKRITEAVDVNLYKLLLNAFGQYTSAFPCTGVDNLFNVLVDEGKKILPTDRWALKILEHTLACYSPPDVVQRILNIRFADLPIEVRPVTRNGKKHEVASWGIDGKISDRIKDLIDFKVSGSKGRWVDIDGNKVTLIEK